MDESKTIAPAADEKPKRKTRTSNAVKLRYNQKTYKTIGCNLRFDTDAELIAAIEQAHADGMNDSAIIKAALYAWLDSRKA